MNNTFSSGMKQGIRIAVILFLWGVIIWLLYPLMTLKDPESIQFGEYFYRSAAGIIIIIILFGKTVTDLFFPLQISRKKAALSTIFLILYCLCLLGAIVYMILRVASLYLNSSTNQIQF
ncbi:MAG: hypothetical protein ACOC57_06765 [Acidobacteriota bacterium]